MLRVLIVEDEQLAAERINRMLLNIDTAIEVAGVLGSVSGVIDWLRNNDHPDLMLLDIQLSDGSSFDIFEELEVNIPVIFTTAYDQFAIEAFKLNSIDYLLKPIRKSELSTAIQKYHSLFSGEQFPAVKYEQLLQAIKPVQKTYQKRIVIRSGFRIKAIEIDQVALFYIQSKVTLMKTIDGHTFPVDFTLEQLEGILDPTQFFRINRQCILQIDAIKEMYQHTKSRIKVETNPSHDQELIVSSERSQNFKRWLTGNPEESKEF